MKLNKSVLISPFLALAAVVTLAACAGIAGIPTIDAAQAPSVATSSAAPAPVTTTATVQETVTVSAPPPMTPVQTRTATTGAAPTRSPIPPRSDGSSDAAIRSDVADAVGVVRTYWTDLFSTWVDDAGRPVSWWSPQLWNGDGFYDSASGLMAYCGADGDNADNAFFCGNVITGTGFVAWDMELFRNKSSLGDTYIYMVVAHETAHAAQVRFVHDGEAPAVLAEYELQADCIAGATIAKAEQDGYLVLEAGDEAELETALYAMEDSSPGDPHGTTQERHDWFYRGYDGDIESCLGNR